MVWLHLVSGVCIPFFNGCFRGVAVAVKIALSARWLQTLVETMFVVPVLGMMEVAE